MRKLADIHILVATLIFGVWLLLIMISPFLVEQGELRNLSGSVFLMDNSIEFSNLNPVAKFVYITGDFNCHQIEERSLYLNNNQMPYCARDTGIFIGLFSGALIALFVVIRMKMYFLFVGIFPLIIDGSLQELSEYESTNSLRIVTGILAGGAIALIISNKIALPIEDELIEEKINSISSEKEEQ